ELWFFFFQAEDGIRDFHVTGVQTCALPICFFLKEFSSATVCGQFLLKFIFILLWHADTGHNQVYRIFSPGVHAFCRCGAQTYQSRGRVTVGEPAAGDKRRGGEEQSRLDIGAEVAVLDTPLNDFTGLLDQCWRRFEKAVTRSLVTSVITDAFLRQLGQ